ncbi:gliding motility-associated C-terminal domain-containing protein [Draconibacterium sp. IB214405]|uniref:T9SS type B sorting domain-containing protein n=1 Tax=Draconibacterium sp. IB214405 TaxID=3097352 RepID=UPI002A16E808|nr:gliding motility-associated C-terminal domain-containing protein [Draconibacterium sp. IB214405]MDX8341390.1 gliding motility-associated C-terminal domain-containing protein [Draconibacterium sp. IB214405]
MKPNLLKLLTYSFILSFSPINAQEIWHESFSVPEKGVWGSNDADYIKTDFEGITKWSLDYSNAFPVDSEDYAKTVTTAGGRFECKDINGEVIWYSEKIEIADYKNVTIQFIATETGSGDNQDTKFLQAFYQLDNNSEQPFEINSEKRGNWGTDTISQLDINGNSLQIIVHIGNFYSADKIILDEVIVSGEEKNPVIINPGDLILNEVLFNPVTDGEDYVEIFNNSTKEIPLNKLYLASRDNDSELTQVYALTSDKLKLLPHEYLALTKDTLGVFPWFTIHCPECFLQMEKFPSFNNDEDYVVLLNNDLEIIDEFYYYEKMHSPIFYDREGIALERISFSKPTNDVSNWHSASTQSGYGTPGYQNSQLMNGEAQKVSVTFQPESFSPNNDGYNDSYSIDLLMDSPGYFCNILIFDSAGRRLCKLADNAVLGTHEQISWNGEDEDGNRLPIGPYIVMVEVFNTEGNVERFKDGVVLTDRF